MRERVTALGGELRAEPRPEGGFTVRARLPWRRSGHPRREPGPPDPDRVSRGGDVMIRVLLVDDQALIRAGFRALLEAEDDIEVVAEAADGERGVALAREHLPDVALVDVQMPVLDGIEATRRIAADPRLSGVHVVILTNYGLDEYVFDALRAGAGGFMVKDTDPADLLQGVRVAARGDALLSPAITRRLIGAYVSRRPDLSPRVLEPSPTASAR
nr:hypothetical protein GCM10020093_070790 [Planobispora longispora]